MTRRDFLKLFGVLPLCGLSQKPTDIQSLFDNASEGEVIDIPPGVHVIRSTLYPKNNQIINGNNALISGSLDGPLMDFTGAGRVTVNNVRFHSDCSGLAAVLLSRSEGMSNGAGNVFHNCIFDGSFSGAVVIVRSEGNFFTECEYITRNGSPSVIYEGNNVTGGWYRCQFGNYSGVDGAGLIRLHSGAGLDFENNYYYVGSNGRAFVVDGSVTTVKISRGRVEGEGAGCLLVDNQKPINLYMWSVLGVAYTIPSDFVFSSDGHLCQWRVDFWTDCRAKQYKGGAGWFWRCDVRGDKPIGANVRMSHLTFVKGNPLPNAGDNVMEWTG